jgi:hypothetical protein
LKISFSKHHIYDWFFVIISFSGEGQFRNFINPVTIVTIIYGCSQQSYVIKFNVMFLWHVFYENSYIFFVTSTEDAEIGWIKKAKTLENDFELTIFMCVCTSYTFVETITYCWQF